MATWPPHGGKRLLIENLTDQAQILENQDLSTVRDRDTCGLLATVLQRIKTE